MSICSAFVHDRRQLQRRHGVQVTRLEASFEQQDGPRPSGIARALRLIEIEQCKAIGVGKRAYCAQQAVSIRIRLDDRPDKPSARMPARKREIAAHRWQVDHGRNRAWHWN